MPDEKLNIQIIRSTVNMPNSVRPFLEILEEYYQMNEYITTHKLDEVNQREINDVLYEFQMLKSQHQCDLLQIVENVIMACKDICDSDYWLYMMDILLYELEDMAEYQLL